MHHGTVTILATSHDVKWLAAVAKPCAPEMWDCIAKELAMQAKLEMDKKYSRDWMNPGRVKVVLAKADGTPCNAECPTKAALLLKCADLCKKHQSRPKRLEQIKQFEAQLFTGGAPQPKQNQAASGSDKSAKGGKGKKGKRK